MPAAAALKGPPRDCPLCPRLVDFRKDNRAKFPDWHNGVVPPFGPADARLMIVGLAPGLRGANRTGRPFTGDHAGGLLYRTLQKFGYAEGVYDARSDDSLLLHRARITNAVRCVPPQNKPQPHEIATCRRFLAAEIASLSGLRAILALGGIAHLTVLAALGFPRGPSPFGHGAVHVLPDGRLLVDSYHCSRQNTNTGRLTVAMFEAVFAALADALARPAKASRSP